MVDMLIEHGLIVTMDKEGRIIRDGAIAIESGIIVDVGSTFQIKSRYVAKERIDAHGKAVLPGLINSHTHLSERLLPGLSDDLSLYPWLKDVVWPAALRMSKEDCYWSALLGCIEMVKSGVTCFSDMFVHHGKTKILNQIAKAVNEAGLRGILSRGIRDDSDVPIGEITLKDTLDAIGTWHGKENRIFIRFGPTITFHNSPELLERIRFLATQHRVGIHTHISETYEEVRMMMKRHGKRTVEYLHDQGFLGPDVLAAHCIWLTENEIILLKEHDVKVVYNPTSNMKLASGVAPIPRILKEGITVGLGSDGSASSDNMDMITIMRIGALLQKVHYLDATLLPSEDVLRMSTSDGARVLLLEGMIGSLEVGKKADLTLIDLKACNLAPVHNIIKQVVYSGHAGNVSMTIVNGEVIAKDGKMTKLNEDEVLSKCQKIAERIVDRV